MSKPKHLTKSRIKLALECPTKLYYTNKAEYPNKKMDNPFLEALAEDGFQVGELAKYYFPNGVDIDELDYETSINRTDELLQKENVIIYEAAIKHDNFFIRCDVLVKKGNSIDLIEVKAKSISETDSFTSKKGKIKANWKPYLYDIAFQAKVLQKAHPEYHISSFLMLANKDAKTSVDALNQKFLMLC